MVTKAGCTSLQHIKVKPQESGYHLLPPSTPDGRCLHWKRQLAVSWSWLDFCCCCISRGEARSWWPLNPSKLQPEVSSYISARLKPRRAVYGSFNAALSLIHHHHTCSCWWSCDNFQNKVINTLLYFCPALLTWRLKYIKFLTDTQTTSQHSHGDTQRCSRLGDKRKKEFSPV